MPMNKASQPTPSLVANSRRNLIAFAVGLAAQFIIVPFVVRWIGLEDFGTAAMMLAICAPLTLVGSVLSQALIREVSSCASEDQDRVVSNSASAALRLCLLICALGWLAIAGFGPMIARPLLGASHAFPDLRLALLVAATGSVFQQLFLVFQGLSAAQQDFQTIARMTLITALAGSCATLGVTWLRPDAIGYLAGVSAGFLLTLTSWSWRWGHVIRWGQVFARRKSDAQDALMRFGKWQGLAQLAGVLGNQIDRYALGAMTSVTLVAQYTIANRLQEAAYIGVIKAGEVLFPKFGSMANQALSARMAYFQTTSWVVGMFSAAMLVPLAMLARNVLTLWVGPQAAVGADAMLFVLVLGGQIGAASNVFTYYAMGIGRNAAVAGLSTGFAVLTIVLTIALIGLAGPQAAGVGLLIASVARVAASIFLTRRLFFPALGWGELFVSTALPAITGVAIAIWGRTLTSADPQTWLEVGLHYPLLSLLVFAVGIALTVTTQTGRHIVLHCMQSLMRRPT